MATEPTELIVTQGEPNYAPIDGTQLLYVSNTTGHVFNTSATRRPTCWCPGAGSAPRPRRPLEFVAGDDLPPDFAEDPRREPEGEREGLGAGTPQAQEAVIANSHPADGGDQDQRGEARPAEVRRRAAAQADRGHAAVLRRRTGHADHPGDADVLLRPPERRLVRSALAARARGRSPPRCRRSSTRSRRARRSTTSPTSTSTRDAAGSYVGYTPGYYGVCVSDGVVVYGTGYSYTPWVGTSGTGRRSPTASGAAMTYTPWTGWRMGFGFGWRWGVETVGWGWGAYPWWGPSAGATTIPIPTIGRLRGGRRGVPRAAARSGARAAGRRPPVTSISRWGATTRVTRASGGYNAWTGNAWRSSAGMSYNSRTGTLAAGQRGGRQRLHGQLRLRRRAAPRQHAHGRTA